LFIQLDIMSEFGELIGKVKPQDKRFDDGDDTIAGAAPKDEEITRKAKNLVTPFLWNDLSF